MPSVEQIRKLLASEPDDVFLNFALAMELAKAEKRDDAVAQFDRVITLDPDYTAAYHHKARTLIAAGRADDARQTLVTGIARAQAIGNAHAAGEMSDLLATL
ncbi:MAG: tetratricopeptide repeat protein [Phycisphaerae bacterium]|nr:tetratricopeptide repeat protein [Phycisphaerae bacterium]